jgi:cytochrome c oxidase cbb3-type subunit IV
MYKNVLQAIEGIGIFPLISLLIFFSIFTAVVIWSFRANKDHLQRMAELPLEANRWPTGREE